MTALVPAPNLTTSQVSRPLWMLLSTGPIENVQQIAEDETMREEVSSCSRSLAVQAEACGSQTVQQALAPLVLVFGLGEQARAAAFWKVYEEQLSDLPRIALDRAIKEYTGVGKFFPKPAEILELAKPHSFAIRQAAWRAKKVLEEAAAVNKRDSRTPEEVAAVKKMLGDFNAQMAAKAETVKPPRRHAVHSGVDSSGVTAEGRAMIEKMRQG